MDLSSIYWYSETTNIIMCLTLDTVGSSAETLKINRKYKSK